VTEKNLVLLGVGHTNAHVVHEWRSRPIKGYRLICVSRFPDATYSGMLPGTLGKQFAPSDMRIELEQLVHRAGGQLILGDVNGFDRPHRCLTFTDREPLAFDILSIGVGSMPVDWDKHTSPSLVPIKPMQTFLERLDQRLASIDDSPQEPCRIAIVGGGVAGIEIALCLRQRLQITARSFAIEIITRSSQIADGMRARSVQRLNKILENANIAVQRASTVSRVEANQIILEDGRSRPADVVIWATGAAAPPVLHKLGLDSDSRGFIATKPTLQAINDDRIFAVGDSGTVIQSPHPKAGVYAVRQCPILWHNLNALATGGELLDFQPQSEFLKLLNTGDGRALLEYKAFTIHARWCLALKTWIDKRFVSTYQHAPG
jgi:pyridine nucleotide-disulfide oxidoreductase family protein